jgi:hypothetical protein
MQKQVGAINPLMQCNYASAWDSCGALPWGLVESWPHVRCAALAALGPHGQQMAFLLQAAACLNRQNYISTLYWVTLVHNLMTGNVTFSDKDELTSSLTEYNSIQTCIKKVLDLTLGCDTDSPNWDCSWSSSLLAVKNSPWFRPWLLPFWSFPIHHSSYHLMLYNLDTDTIVK